MINPRNVPRKIPVVLALGVLAALPACSNMMGGRSGGQAGTGMPAAASTALDPDLVRQVQTRLRDDGYYKQGAIDGLWGDGTQSALKNFQRDHSIAPTGGLNGATLAALNITNGRVPATDMDHTSATDPTMPPPAPANPPAPSQPR